jgi:probable rRNA maturation factor
VNKSAVTVQIDLAPEYENLVDQSLLENAVREATAVAAHDPANDLEPENTQPTAHTSRLAAHSSWLRAYNSQLTTHDSQLVVSIRVTDDVEMQRLNSRYRGVDKTTDVLSFALIDSSKQGPHEVPAGQPLPLGDIAISYPYAERHAKDLAHSIDKELAWLTIHGTLQLLGYSHYTDPEAQDMEALEQKALTLLGFSDASHSPPDAEVR